MASNKFLVLMDQRMSESLPDLFSQSDLGT